MVTTKVSFPDYIESIDYETITIKQLTALVVFIYFLEIVLWKH